MTIHSDHPFATPEDARAAAGCVVGSAARCRCGPPGTGAARAGPDGLVAAGRRGEPSFVIGLLDPDSDLADALRVDAARCVVQLLEWRHHDVAEQFAGQMPAPGGLFAADTWVDTPFGPRLADVADLGRVRGPRRPRGRAGRSR